MYFSVIYSISQCIHDNSLIITTQFFNQPFHLIRMVKLLSISPSSDADKKYDVKLETASGREKTVRIGAKGMDDFTKTHDEDQKARYIARHAAREDWRLSGVLSSGFWSRWLLWNKPSLAASKEDVKRRFNL